MSNVTRKRLRLAAIVCTLSFAARIAATALGFGLNALVRHANEGCMPALHERELSFMHKGCYMPLDEHVTLPLFADRFEMTIGLFTDNPGILDHVVSLWADTITTASPPYYGYYSIGDAVQWFGETVRLLFGPPFFILLAIFLVAQRRNPEETEK